MKQISHPQWGKGHLVPNPQEASNTATSVLIAVTGSGGIKKTIPVNVSDLKRQLPVSVLIEYGYILGYEVVAPEENLFSALLRRTNQPKERKIELFEFIQEDNQEFEDFITEVEKHPRYKDKDIRGAMQILLG